MPHALGQDVACYYQKTDSFFAVEALSGSTLWRMTAKIQQR